MAKNTHLTLDERATIEVSLREGTSFTEIGRLIGKIIAIEVQIEYTVNRKADVTPLVWLTPKIRSDARRKGLRLAGSDKTRKRCRT